MIIQVGDRLAAQLASIQYLALDGEILSAGGLLASGDTLEELKITFEEDTPLATLVLCITSRWPNIAKVRMLGGEPMSHDLCALRVRCSLCSGLCGADCLDARTAFV